MSSTASMSSTATDTGPPTSPMNVSSHLESDGHGCESKQSLTAVGIYWCRSSETWTDQKPVDCLVVTVKNPKNAAVCGALHKYQQGIPNKRLSGDYMRAGILDWLRVKGTSVNDPITEEAFVRHVWFHKNEAARRNRAAKEAEKLARGLGRAQLRLSAHYEEYPNERKSEVELTAMFRRLGSWAEVVCFEQRRIASKKRHDKEERLISDKFCGDRAAYNCWKSLNEKVSLGRVRNVSPQLLVKFAKWFNENPDYLFPGSRDISYSDAGHKIAMPMTLMNYEKVMMTRADVSAEDMLAAITSVMDGLNTGTCTVTLKLDRSPKQFTMTDKYPLLLMHGCERLISGSEHHIVAVHNDKLVFKQTTNMIKRLPDEYHKQLKGHCEREGLFKEITGHKVFEYTPGLVTSALFRGQTSDGEKFHIRLRLTARANKTFSFDMIQNKKRNDFLQGLWQEAAAKKSMAQKTRAAAARASPPPSPSGSRHIDMAKEIIELGKMFKDGLLDRREFNRAKANLLR